MLDKDKVKRFWDDRASTFESVAFESIANLEQDKNNLELKIDLETQKVFDWLGDVSGKSILDLGAGVGQWTFRFAARGCSKVTAVEYSAPLAEIGKKEALRQTATNVEFIVSPAEKYVATEPYDIVFISGLFVYLNDDQAEELMQNLPKACGKNTTLLLRDGTGILDRHEINDRLSEHLQSNYSATYRTRDQYVGMFAAAGFSVLRDENMFEEGNPLNKYAETRLRIYQFKPDA
ncbi:MULTISPECIES: class I SAM-dependent methyltransferase [Agrobacterium]|uniref:2-polyprenyl-3-methyl-5-hydroxy-6-metoxy-1, 4-benzoquinol methylase n=1 Tax=Agrobacterium larrymoorei TaxID=160699 RepID=A0AAJ2BS64_9HYPH|nr:class I SAM-dependent methyltransferase [Agrobacterium larrymoorei]MDQ1197849.1 2-polyprenyl-3-methyl-5-hydroxy-6-metoxy-1,4-benzoquinol methylase [Rhizobium sp. SORGH_AS_0787]MDR6104495.1 2-polyprenyl-3-methyl-5-hydroxy-6-metoxy-1,4-benzoquinol methylase [Agrobacterium larrymoorei]